MTAETGSITIAVVQIVFTIALLPTLFDEHAAVPRATSVMTAAGLWVIAFVYLQLALYAAMVAASAAAFVWSCIFIFRPVYR